VWGSRNETGRKSRAQQERGALTVVPLSAGEALMAHSPARPEPMTAMVPDRPAARSASLTRRLIGHLLPGTPRPAPANLTAHPLARRPVQLALPLSDPSKADAGAQDLTAAPLFHAARAVEPVLSYEQASLERVVPGAALSSAPTQDPLTLPGGTGLILYEPHAGAMAFDWMQWGSRSATPFGATVDAQALRQGRAGRRLAQRRCVVPLTRFSMPVRDGAVWSHRWIEPVPGAVICAAGIWSAERDADGVFAMVTRGSGGAPEGPILLTENEVLLWLRAPLVEVLDSLTDNPSETIT